MPNAPSQSANTPQSNIPYEDYTAREAKKAPWRRFFGRRGVALVVLLLAVVLSSGYGARRSLNAEIHKVEQFFYTGVYLDGDSLNQKLYDYAGEVNNLITVARRNPGAVDGDLLDKLSYAAAGATVLNEHGSLRARRDAYENARHLSTLALDQLAAVELPPQDAKYVQSFRADLNGIADKINRDRYNSVVEEFYSDTLYQFPTNALAALFNISGPQGF